MNASVKRIVLDLNRQDSMQYVYVRKGDTAKVIIARLAESGTPYELTADTEAVLAAKLPDGTYIYESASIVDNHIEVVLPITFTAAAGMLLACFRIVGDEAALITPDFTICISDPAAPEET